MTLLTGATRLFAGTPKKLYEAGASTWTDVSRAATYNVGTTARWRFAQFANTTLSANGTDTVQSSVSSGAFSCIAGAPIAAIVETVGAFAFAVNTSSNAHGWQCSAINDVTNWSVSVATQSTTGVLTATPGQITAAKSFGSNIVLYKQNSMYLGTYVGPPNIWQFDQIVGTAGAMSQESVIRVGTSENPKHIFMGSDDFYLYDGSKPVPIGTNRVKDTVFGALNQNRYYACAALHDSRNTRIYFYYPVSDSVFPDHCVVYNYRTDRWGVDDRQIQAVTQFSPTGITYGGLGGVYNTYADLPNLPYNSAFLATANNQPAVFSTSAFLQTLSGQAGMTGFTSGDYGDNENFYVLTRVRPQWITAPSSAVMTDYYRNNSADTLTAGVATALSSENTFDVLREARWHRLGFSLTGDWELAMFTPDYAEAGLE